METNEVYEWVMIKLFKYNVGLMRNGIYSYWNYPIMFKVFDELLDKTDLLKVDLDNKAAYRLKPNKVPYWVEFQPTYFWNYLDISYFWKIKFLQAKNWCLVTYLIDETSTFLVNDLYDNEIDRMFLDSFFKMNKLKKPTIFS